MAMLTTAEICHVLACYDLGEPLRAWEATVGRVNETVFVETGRGRFVVRRNHWRFSEAALRYRHALMIWLGERGIPTPVPLPAHGGDTLVASGRRFYEVCPFVAGTSYDPSLPLQLEQLGATLARYHQAVLGYPAPPQFTPARYGGGAALALREQLVEQDVMGDLADLIAWYSRQAAQLHVLLPTEMYARLPALVIHGDIHADNIGAGNGFGRSVSVSALPHQEAQEAN